MRGGYGLVRAMVPRCHPAHGGRRVVPSGRAASMPAVEHWRRQLGEARFGHLQRALRVVVRPGPLRPAW
jgi:hypothetical protein